MRWYIRHILRIQINAFMWIFIHPYIISSEWGKAHKTISSWYPFIREIMTSWIFTESKYRLLDLVALKLFHVGFLYFFFSHQWICIHSFHRDYRIQGTVSMLQHMVKTYGWLLFCLYLLYLFILNYVIHIISWNPFKLLGYE